MATGRKTGGRIKGTPNKTTKSVKEAILGAYTKMGGNAALVRWGKENPSDFYKLWAKLLPVEIGGNADNPIPIVHRIETVVVDPANTES